MPFKTTVNWLFNDICHLVIGCFDWKIGVFQQTVLRGLLYPLCLFHVSKFQMAIVTRLLSKTVWKNDHF